MMRRALILVTLLAIALTVLADSAGPRLPATCVDDAAAGSEAWSDPGNATAEDGFVASVVIPEITSTITHYLKATGFGFSIPAGATVDGITVEVRRAKFGLQLTMKDNELKIVKGGVVGATNKADTGTWPGTLTYKSYGGPSDLWGEIWTPADINSSNFGVVLSAIMSSSSTGSLEAQVDAFRITVNFTPAAGKARKRDPVVMQARSQTRMGGRPAA